MTDREFWQRFSRHLKGLADLAKAKMDEPGDVVSTMEGYDIRWAYNEKQELIGELVREKGHPIHRRGGDCEEVAGRG